MINTKKKMLKDWIYKQIIEKSVSPENMKY